MQKSASLDGGQASRHRCLHGLVLGAERWCGAQVQVLHSTLTPHQSLETRQLTPTLPIPDAGEDARAEGLVEPTDVDAYWLQRRVSKCFPGMGAQESQALAEQAFAILQVPSLPRVKTTK